MLLHATLIAAVWGTQPSCKPRPDPSVYRLGVLLTVGPEWPLGSAVPAVPLAIKAANKLLAAHNSTLEWRWEDSACTASTAMQRAQNLYTEHFLDAFIGPACSIATSGVAKSAFMVEKPIISWAAGSSEFSDKLAYPTFTRTVGTVPKIAEAYLGAVKHFGWKTFQIWATEEPLWQSCAWAMQSSATDNSTWAMGRPGWKKPPITYFPADGDVEAMAHIINTAMDKSNVIIVWSYCGTYRNILSAAKSLGMLDENRFTFWAPEINAACRDTGDGDDASKKRMRELFTGTFTSTYYIPDTPVVRTFYSETKANRNNFISSYTGRDYTDFSADLENFFEQDTTAVWAVFLYDAIMLYAHALAGLLARGDTHAQIRDPDRVEQFVAQIKKTSFLSLSGLVKPDANGDCNPMVKLQNFCSAETGTASIQDFAFFNTSVPEPFRLEGGGVQDIPGFNRDHLVWVGGELGAGSAPLHQQPTTIAVSHGHEAARTLVHVIVGFSTVVGVVLLLAIVVVALLVHFNHKAEARPKFFAYRDATGQMKIESKWNADEETAAECEWTWSENNKYDYTDITPSAGAPASTKGLFDRMVRLFHNGGPRAGPTRGFEVTRVHLIRNADLRRNFDSQVGTFEDRIAANPTVFKIPFSDDGVKQGLLERFHRHSMPTEGLDHARIVLAWHGCSHAALSSICSLGTADLRRNDGGFFGAGIYLTPHSEYAAKYSRLGNRNEHKEYVMLLCMIVVANTYPISRKTDYPHSNEKIPGSVSVFHYEHPVPYNAQTRRFDLQNTYRSDKSLMAGFDSHFVSVNSKICMEATDDNDYDFDEIVVKSKEQVLPIAILYFKTSGDRNSVQVEMTGIQTEDSARRRGLSPMDMASSTNKLDIEKAEPALETIPESPRDTTPRVTESLETKQENKWQGAVTADGRNVWVNMATGEVTARDPTVLEEQVDDIMGEDFNDTFVDEVLDES